MPDIDAMTDEEFFRMLCAEVRETLDAMRASLDEAEGLLREVER